MKSLSWEELKTLSLCLHYHRAGVVHDPKHLMMTLVEVAAAAQSISWGGTATLFCLW